MTPARELRVSLALPLDSPQRIRAAIDIIAFLLRSMRVELELLNRGYAAAERTSVPPIILVAGNLPVMHFDTQTAPRAERALGVRIERIYARHGVVPASFDLQIL